MIKRFRTRESSESSKTTGLQFKATGSVMVLVKSDNFENILLYDKLYMYSLYSKYQN